MFLFHIVFALLFAILYAAALAAVFGWRHPARRGEDTSWSASIFLFLVLFFVIWAGGVWIGPFGPGLWLGTWLPFLVVGLVVSLVILAVAAPRRRERPRRDEREAPAEDDPTEKARASVIYGLAFWWLLLVLFAVLFFGYLR